MDQKKIDAAAEELFECTLGFTINYFRRLNVDTIEPKIWAAIHFGFANALQYAGGYSEHEAVAVLTATQKMFDELEGLAGALRHYAERKGKTCQP